MIDPQTLVVVTATSADARWERFYLQNLWRLHLATERPLPELVTVFQGTDPAPSDRGDVAVRVPDYLGVVPAFTLGCQIALQLYPQAEVFACLHDDCLLYDDQWQERVLEYFAAYPACGLLGFGGARQLGEENFWDQAYRPHLLVRKDFMSNMQDAEAHGRRVTTPRQVAVLDGFSLIFRRGFLGSGDGYNRWDSLRRRGFMHHAYDAAMGILAAAGGWEVHLLPLACRHLGGQTAVGEARYQDWARTQHPDGDQGFWEAAHRATYNLARELRVPMPIVVAQPENRESCPTCKSKGFLPSVLGPSRCTFCDGTEGGNPPGSTENPR